MVICIPKIFLMKIGHLPLLLMKLKMSPFFSKYKQLWEVESKKKMKVKNELFQMKADKRVNGTIIWKGNNQFLRKIYLYKNKCTLQSARKKQTKTRVWTSSYWLMLKHGTEMRRLMSWTLHPSHKEVGITHFPFHLKTIKSHRFYLQTKWKHLHHIHW